MSGRAMTKRMVIAFMLAAFGAVFAAAETTLTVWNMPPEADAMYKQLWDEAVTNFEKLNPGIRINGISREYKPQEFVSVMASGKGPDIARIPISALPVMARYGFLAPLDRYAQNWFVKDFMPEIMWNSVKSKDRIFGIPNDSYFTVLFYRKGIFQAAGVTKTPETWQDIIEISERVHRTDKNVWGIALQCDLFYFIDFIWQAGGYILKDGVIDFKNPGVVKAARFWHDLKWKYGAMPPQNVFYDYDVEQLFSTGKTAMMVGVSKRLPVMARRYGLDINDVEIVPLPAGPEGIKAWHVAGEAYVINAAISPEKKELAWKYIEDALNPFNQLIKWQRMKELGMKSFPEDFSCATKVENMPEFMRVKNLMEFASIEPTMHVWPMVKEDFNKQVLEKIMTTKIPDIEQVLYDFDKHVRARYGR
jgi:ABC-type glycerol-3-phosphate transport system substrate-binding protein